MHTTHNILEYSTTNMLSFSTVYQFKRKRKRRDIKTDQNTAGSRRPINKQVFLT
jgi:hypothetical protein